MLVKSNDDYFGNLTSEELDKALQALDYVDGLYKKSNVERYQEFKDRKTEFDPQNVLPWYFSGFSAENCASHAISKDEIQYIGKGDSGSIFKALSIAIEGYLKYGIRYGCLVLGDIYNLGIIAGEKMERKKHCKK